MKYVRAFVIGGFSNSGKSTWTDVYQKKNQNVLRFCLDTFFREPKYERVAGFVHNIGSHCYSSKFNPTAFLEVAEDKLNAIREASGIVDVLVEGFVVQFLSRELEQLLRDVGCDEIVGLDFNKFSFDYFGTKIRFGKASNASREEKLAACEQSIKRLKQIDFQRLKRGINYQSFPDFNHRGTSNSPGKLAGLLVKANESFLDIGCNNGYFCFEAAKKTTGKVVGIDRGRDVIAIARNLNHRVFRRQNVEFLVRDAFGLSGLYEKFDHIFCASVFHYFQDKQEEFFSVLTGLMHNDSVAAVEIETDPNNARPEKSSGRRGLAYPNRLWIEQKASRLLRLVNVERSADQKGAEYPRFFYFFRRR